MATESYFDLYAKGQEIDLSELSKDAHFRAVLEESRAWRKKRADLIAEKAAVRLERFGPPVPTTRETVFRVWNDGNPALGKPHSAVVESAPPPTPAPPAKKIRQMQLTDGTLLEVDGNEILDRRLQAIENELAECDDALRLLKGKLTTARLHASKLACEAHKDDVRKITKHVQQALIVLQGAAEDLKAKAALLDSRGIMWGPSISALDTAALRDALPALAAWARQAGLLKIEDEIAA